MSKYNMSILCWFFSFLFFNYCCYLIFVLQWWCINAFAVMLMSKVLEWHDTNFVLCWNVTVVCMIVCGPYFFLWWFLSCRFRRFHWPTRNPNPILWNEDHVIRKLTNSWMRGKHHQPTIIAARGGNETIVGYFSITKWQDS